MEKKRLTDEERSRMIKGFIGVTILMILPMILFRLTDTADVMLFVVAGVGIVLTLVVAPILEARQAERRVWIGMAVIGLATSAGALLGWWITGEVQLMLA